MAKELTLDAPLETDATDRKRKATWWEETKSIAWLLLAVLGFHSFIAKPFYIPSESMLSGLEVGDRLVVNKFAYGWSFVSPTIPNPAAIFRSLVLRQPEESWGVQLPFTHGRLFGHLPERGDVAIVTPPGTNNDYIKRVIGLPGDTIAVRNCVVILNGVAVKRGPLHYVDLPDYGGVQTDEGETCQPDQYLGSASRLVDDRGRIGCRLPVVTETLPNGRTYDTVESEENSPGDNFPATKVPAGHVFMMGDNRDHSADSRFQLGGIDRGLGGPVPWEYLGGRAEFITFSLDGSAGWNPISWFRSLRSGRAGTSLHPAETTR